MNKFFTALACIFVFTTAARAESKDPLIDGWRTVVNARLAQLIPSNTPGVPSKIKLVRLMGLKSLDEADQVLRGELPFTLDHANDISERYLVDRSWLIGADYVHRSFPTYIALVTDLANESEVIKQIWQEAYSLHDEHLIASWPKDDAPIGAPTPSYLVPYLTADACSAQLADFSGRELLKIQAAITRELVRRNGMMK